MSDLQQKSVWEGWLGAEIRANYFADLSSSYQWRQKILTWLILLFSSGAFLTLVTSGLPDSLSWLKPTFALIAACMSFLSLIGQNQKNAIECADLHFKWNRLSAEYAALWEDMYSEDALATLRKLQEKSAELSRSGVSFPNRTRKMLKWQDHVERHHAASGAPA